MRSSSSVSPPWLGSHQGVPKSVILFDFGEGVKEPSLDFHIGSVLDAIELGSLDVEIFQLVFGVLLDVDFHKLIVQPFEAIGFRLGRLGLNTIAGVIPAGQLEHIVFRGTHTPRGFGKLLGHRNDLLSGVNGEVQVDPTIRPVLDLSDIEAGTSAIDSMFGGYGYTVASGISVQNPNASMNDLINKMMAQQSMLSTAPAGSPINMYVYAAPGQSEEEIANMVEQKLMFRINRNGGVWR